MVHCLFLSKRLSVSEVWTKLGQGERSYAPDKRSRTEGQMNGWTNGWTDRLIIIGRLQSGALITRQSYIDCIVELCLPDGCILSQINFIIYKSDLQDPLPDFLYAQCNRLMMTFSENGNKNSCVSTFKNCYIYIQVLMPGTVGWKIQGKLKLWRNMAVLITRFKSRRR